MNITLLDYLRTIVNLNRSNTTWTLDPRVEMGKEVMGEASAPRGIGNQVSCEFNLVSPNARYNLEPKLTLHFQVYRWHSSISKKQEKWTHGLYKELFGKEPEEVSLPELLKGLSMWEKSLDKDPQKRPFAHLKRGADGKFDDSELVHILTEAIEDPAGRIRPSMCQSSMVTRCRFFWRKSCSEGVESGGDSRHATSTRLELWITQRIPKVLRAQTARYVRGHQLWYVHRSIILS